MSQQQFGPVFHDPDDLDQSNEDQLSKMFQDFYALCKKGEYTDTQEDFQRFVSAEWVGEEKLHKK